MQSQIFVLGHYLFLVHVAHTVCFSEQIMAADKYLRIFSRQIVTIVYIFIGLKDLFPTLSQFVANFS